MTDRIDTIRRRFLEKQLSVLPTDVISIIRNYDTIHRDHFRKRILTTLSTKVYVFWHNKMLDYTKNPYNGNLEFYNYIKRVDEYYDILWNILVVPPINICTEEYEEYTEYKECIADY
jgi:hypothetical protein